MTRPHIEPMRADERPTEPGYYFVHHQGSTAKCTMLVEVDQIDGPRIRLAADWDYETEYLVFDARVHLDRIIARAQALSDLAAMDGETL